VQRHHVAGLLGASAVTGGVPGVGKQIKVLAHRDYCWDASSWLSAFCHSDEGLADSSVLLPYQAHVEGKMAKHFICNCLHDSAS